MSIHASDPFSTPEELRSPVRRLRGRLPSAVTLWSAENAGLTVSSMLVVDGDPGRVVGLVDEESDFWTAVEQGRTFAVTLLADGDQQLADRFAGLMPSPGGLFVTGDWVRTEWGPVHRDRTWVGCRLDEARSLGWSLLVEATIERIELGSGSGAAAPLVHERGRYRRR